MNNMQNSNEESREEGVGTFSSTSKGLSENLKKTDKAWSQLEDRNPSEEKLMQKELLPTHVKNRGKNHVCDLPRTNLNFFKKV